MKSAHEYIIDIDNLHSFKAQELDHLIFSSEAKKLRDKVLYSLAEGPPPCIFINGSRGSGKSTFLRAVRNNLCTKNSTIKLLMDIDPSQLSANENFFVYCISEIKKLLHEYSKQKDHIATIRQINQTLSHMAEGLVSLSTPPQNTDSMDANICIENDYERCMSSSKLHHDFEAVLQHLSKLIGKEKFLVTIDDPDMNPAKCYEIIESIRKYMINPYVIFLFAGDIKLYTLVLRGNQMNHFTKLAWKYDVPNEGERFRMLTHLGSQYMLKMFPVEYRFHLPNSEELFSYGHRKYVLQWKHDQKSEQTPLPAALHDLLRSSVGSVSLESWKPVLKSLPLRSILQLLGHFAKCKMERGDTAEALTEASTESIMQVFSSLLITEGIDYESIHGGNRSALFHIASEYGKDARKDKLMEEGYASRYSQTEQICSLFLNAEICKNSLHISQKLLWFCSLYPYLYAHKNIGRALEPKVLAHLPGDGGYRNTLGALFLKEPNLYAQWGADTTALMLSGEENEMKSTPGVILFPCSIAKNIFADSGDNLNEEMTLAALRNSLCTIGDSHDKQYYLSVFNLVGLIVNCLQIAESSQTKGDPKTGTKRVLGVLFSSTLPANSQRLSELGPVPDRKNNSTPTPFPRARSRHSSTAEHKIENLRDEISSQIYAWAETFHQEVKFTHTSLYSAAWEYFIYNDTEANIDLPDRYLERDFQEAYDALRRFTNEIKRFAQAFVLLTASDDNFHCLMDQESDIESFPLVDELYKLANEPEAFFRRYKK